MRVLSIAELLDHIIDFLQGDCKDLRHASLVCKSWNLSTALPLFRCLGVSCLDQHTGRHDAFIPRWLALKSSPRVCNNVRDLTLRNFPLSKESRHLSVQLLQLTLEMLPFLQTLSIYAIDTSFTSTVDVALPAPQGLIQNLSSFELATYTRWPDDLTVILPHIPTLFAHLDNFTYWHGGHNSTDESYDAPRTTNNENGKVDVKQLTLVWLASSQEIRKLCQVIDTSKLRKLCLQVYLPDKFLVREINTFLFEHAPCLRELDIEVEWCCVAGGSSIVGSHWSAT